MQSLQGDALVSVLEMRPGLGDVDVDMLNLLDQMRQVGGTWLLKRVTLGGTGASRTTGA